jgi:hypothetical protein
MNESRKKYETKLVLLLSEQVGAIQQDANERYPTLHGPTGQRRNFNPALRDIIDFWHAHRPLFFAWIANRSASTQQED